MGIIDLIRKISNRTPNSDQTDSESESDNSSNAISNTNQNETSTQSSSSSQNPSATTSSNSGTSSSQPTTASPHVAAAGSSSSSPSPSPLSIVARADASGRPVHHTSPIRRKGNKARFNSAAHELTVEEVHPALVSPKCKPNDIILLYRDISELFTTGVKP